MHADRSALTWFVGWDVRRGASSEQRAQEVLALTAGTKGAADTYELLAVAARGFRPPEILTITDIAREDHARESDGGRERSEPRGSALRQAWSLFYRPIAETNPRGSIPYAIYFLGVNPPDGLTEEDLEVFNDFYTNVHLREVAERRHALRAVRYELVREVKTPMNGAPRFLAVYEVNEESASQRKHVGPPYSSGPAVWQHHRTPWRLWYRISVDREE